MKKALVLLAILLLIPPNYSLNDVKIVVGPYTQNVTNNSITILWETNVETANNSIEYWNGNEKYVVHDFNKSIHHEITIYPPFSHGNYVVSSNGVKSRVLEFKIASYCYETGKFRCIIYGDSRGEWDNWEAARKVANAINKEKPDFVIHGGDMVANGKDLTQWEEWLDFMMPLMQNATLYGVLGNHERNGSRYYEIFSLPNNEMWYSFYYGPCLFVILDEYAPWNETSPQYKWMEKTLALPSAFKIVCFHEPIYCSGGHSPRKDIREVWEPLFIKYGVDIVFQSHNHYYERTNPINGIIYVVTGGGGAPLYSPGAAWYINKSRKAYHYCILDVNLSSMSINFYAKDLNGNVFDEFTITRTSIEILKPEKGLYLFNRKIAEFPYPLIIGGIEVIAKAEGSVKSVAFYIDGNLKFNDTMPPYQWLWDEPAIGWHEIMVKAYGKKVASKSMMVEIFNI